MKVLLDTNILARMAQPGHLHHPIALSALDLLRRRGDKLFLVPQTIYEFWVICTRPLEQNGLGLRVSMVVERVDQAKSLFEFLADTEAIFPAWEGLVREFEVQGKDAHDVRLVAAMRVHRLDAILTFNVADFSRYPGAKVIDPAKLPSATQ